MSEQVKNAIDTGLCGLCVTEGDVAAILRRARMESAQAHREERPRANWRFGTALALVMLMLLAAVGWRLATQGVDEPTPLTQPETEVTGSPAGFVPVESEPVVNIDAAQAIALAEAYVSAHHDPSVDLRDTATYGISCEYIAAETAEGASYANFYTVCFRALTVEATEYRLRVSAEDGSILSCEMQRGVGEWHTAQEIYAGYARVYGADRRAWTQAQLRTYCLSLRKAAGGSMRWEDYLYVLSGYPDVAENAMDRGTVIAAVMDDIDTLLYEHDRKTGTLERWQAREQVGDVRARYISAYPNPVWKVAVDQRVVNADGYATTRTVLFEVDSVTGEVKHTEAVEAAYAFQYESFTRSTIDGLMATSTNDDVPTLTEAEYRAIAAEYIRLRWHETRDVNDGKLFTSKQAYGGSPAIQVGTQLIYRSTGAGDVTEYVVVIDWYGGVVAANRSVTPAGEASFTPVATDADWEREKLLAWQVAAAQCPRAQEPVYQAFIGTAWLADTSGGTPKAVQNAALAAIGAKTTTRMMSVQIAAEPAPVWKVALESDQGNFLIELDSVSLEPLHVLQVEGLYQSWYLPFVLTADLKAAGAAIPEDAAPVYMQGATEAHGVTDGMRVDYIYERFKQLYGPNMGLWTPAQLRSFQRMAILSNDYDYDLGVLCLRNTVYPDVPENALPPAEAMVCALAPIGLSEDPADWTLCGAVLIGTAEDSAAHGTPVWKLCLMESGGGIWYAEVNCMTGKIYRLHEDAVGNASPGASYDYGTPQNLWFRDIVLETTIEDCDAVWQCRGNG